jgi:hypothetical protein
MKRSRPLDLVELLEAPLQLQKLSGSGTEQAPAVLSLLCAAGVHATHQSSPPGVAVYLRGSTLAEGASPTETTLHVMCGIAPDQDELEAHFALSVRRPLLLRRLAGRFARLRPNAALTSELAPLEAAANDFSRGVPEDLISQAEAEAQLDTIAHEAIRASTAPMGATELQLSREWQRLLAAHSSLANACFARFCEATGVHVQDASLIASSDPSRARILLLLYDRTVHEAQQRPRPFAWLPSLRRLLLEPETLPSEMAQRLWVELRLHNYHPPEEIGALAPYRACAPIHGSGSHGTVQPSVSLVCARLQSR